MINLIGRLKQRLENPLPGTSAHERMLPRIPGGSRVKFKYSEEPRKGAVLILLYEYADQIWFPLIQRPQYEGVHSGQIALPGGRHEEEDNDLVATAIREAKEEVGVDPESIEVIGQLSEFMVTASNHLVLPVIGFTTNKPNFIPDPYEVDEVIEASLDELLDETFIKETQITTSGGYRLHSPYFDVKGKVVWGATAMMLSEFVQIIKEL
ncbi:MAG: coenzyme A pyrophosphatase [Flammeovirgaceae bacterium]|nr:coenzyme A pyrophosphatase [Flammeovirgaceae bacterium]HCX22463.1 coenzyme A pyrophosphatase [Cytophagales bacterium]|tara:strand:+ start:1627 stop:2253 length:627 start_codon:yes stop_codon:yes gene_type:complete